MAQSSQWTLAKSFIDDQTKIMVEVNELTEPHGKRYTIKVGKQISREGKDIFSPYIGATKDRFCITHAKLYHPFASVLARLVLEAEAWILAELEAVHQASLENRIEKEEQQANYGKPVTRQTGKTARKRERQSRQS